MKSFEIMVSLRFTFVFICKAQNDEWAENLVFKSGTVLMIVPQIYISQRILIFK